MQNLDKQTQTQGSLGDKQPLDYHPTGDQVGAEKTGSKGGGDFLDKGVKYGEERAGHPQKAGTTEKISDGIRSGFKKMTGKDVPIQDKQAS